MDNVKWYGREFMLKASEVNFDAMDRAGFLLERHIKKSFGTGAPAGHSYKRTKTGKRHTPSADGEIPAVDSGALRASIIHQTEKTMLDIVGKVGSATDIIKAKTGSDMDYGLYLEIGTRNTAARPWLRPGLDATRNEIFDIFKKANGK